MEQFLATLWYILVLIPIIYWFFILRILNTKTNSTSLSVLFSLFYLIPLFGHLWLAWSFLKDLRETQIKSNTTPVILTKTYITKFVLPYIFLIIGLNIFVIVGILFLLIPYIGGPIGNSVIWLATFVPYLSFIWLTWGFWSVYTVVKKLP